MNALADRIVDRFVCRREGHKPSFRLTATSGFEIESYLTTCLRCGRVYEERVNKWPMASNGCSA